MSTEYTETQKTPVSEITESATRAVENLTTIARLWTTQGLEMGRSVLVSSAESLKLVAETLADVKARVNGEPAPAETTETTPEA